MPDSPPPSPDLPPRLIVTLPGGGQVEGRLLAWPQAPDGTWHAKVTVQVPGAAVRPIPGEDYSEVLRVPAEPPAMPTALVPAGAPAPADPGWAIAAVGRTAGDQEVHRTDRCWMDLVAVQPATEQEAAAAIEAGTPACTVCRPNQP